MKVRDRKRHLAASTALYLRQVGRKAQKGIEPNDRRHDRQLEEKLGRMPAEQVDALFRDEGD